MKMLQVAENWQMHIQAIAALAFLLKATRHVFAMVTGLANLPLDPGSTSSDNHHLMTTAL
jgi:hypothetical protein